MKLCSTEQEYIETIALPVQKACKRYGYLPSVLIAQSCLENGYGITEYWDNPQIEVLLASNNMVGIKSSLLNDSWNEYTVWTGKSISKKTPEEYSGKMVTITDNFRVYETIERSFCDFLLFLTYASNYGKGGVPKYGEAVLNLKDPEKLIKTVAGKGYATGSSYPTSVMRILNKHNLTKYDDLSKIEPSMIIPNSLKLKYGVGEKTVAGAVKLASRQIIDVTAQNKSEVPRTRGSNPIQFIVVHYLGVPNADNENLYGGGYGGHYYVSRAGKVYCAADPVKSIVWHCGGGLQGSGGHKFHNVCTNMNSIGIECGVCYDGTEKDPSGDSDKWFFTEATQESLVWLVSYLMDKYGIPTEHVIRHYDVTGKICPNPYVKNNHTETSWTWGEFKLNVAQYRENGTITVPNGAPAVQPVEEEKEAVAKNALSVNMRTLSKGSQGKDVKVWQIICGTDPDGDFGAKTHTATVKWQKANGLDADGYVGKKTWTKALNGLA